MIVSLVVAVAANGVIGRDNAMPWRLPDDLAHFKALTLGKPVIMGRRTWESLRQRPLPGRHNIVVTRQTDYAAAGATVTGSLSAAFTAAGAVPEIAVIGGTELYAQALAYADVIHLTRVHAEPDGDALFPALAPDDWQETGCVHHPADARHAHAFDFVRLERKARIGGDGPEHLTADQQRASGF